MNLNSALKGPSEEKPSTHSVDVFKSLQILVSRVFFVVISGASPFGFQDFNKFLASIKRLNNQQQSREDEMGEVHYCPKDTLESGVCL